MLDLLKKIVDIFFSEKKPKKLLKKSNHIPIKNVKVIESNNQAIINNQVIKKNVKVLEKETLIAFFNSKGELKLILILS